MEILEGEGLCLSILNLLETLDAQTSVISLHPLTMAKDLTMLTLDCVDTICTQLAAIFVHQWVQSLPFN